MSLARIAAIALLGSLSILLGSVAPTAAQTSVTVTVPYGSLLNDCGNAPLCGGQGWVWPNRSDTWAGGIRTFVDPTPPGAVVRRVQARALGLCDGRPSGIAVNGNALGTIAYTGTTCECGPGPCSATNTVSVDYPSGMPGWVDGGLNQVSLPSAHVNFVLVAVELTLFFDGCGDGVVQPGEECDNGAANSDTAPDACRTDCTRAHCGDGVLDTGEGCDAGAGNSDTMADACRTTCMPAQCGDGVIDTGEACDDGASGSAACSPSCERTLDAGVPDAGRTDPTDASHADPDAGGSDAGSPSSREGGCGCSAPGGQGREAAWLALALAALFVRRRRRVRRLPTSRSGSGTSAPSS